MSSQAPEASPQRPPQPDLDEIRRSIEVVFGGLSLERVAELRVIDFVQDKRRPFPVTLSGYFSDPEAMAREAHRTSRQEGTVYTTLNPVVPALLARGANRLERVGKKSSAATDPDVAIRRWLLVDLDPVRPALISSTEAELAESSAMAEAVRAELAARGWPDPVEALSGNGYHLLYLLDLPNDAESRELARCALEALGERFDTETVKVDRKVFNAARLVKLWGTVSNKGEHCPQIGRPWRTSRLLDVPEQLERVHPDCLRSIAADWIPEAEGGRNPGRRDANPPIKPARAAGPKVAQAKVRLEGWLKSWGLDHGKPLPFGGGGWKWELAGPCPGPCGEDDAARVVGVHASGAFFFSCLHNRCSGFSWRDFRACYDASAKAPAGSALDFVKGLVEAHAVDAGAVKAPAALAAIAEVREEHPAEWDRQRAALKKAGVRIGELEGAATRYAREQRLASATQGGKDRIKVSTDIRAMALAAEASLAKCENVYQRGGLLVRIERSDDGAPTIQPLPKPSLAEELSARTVWTRETKDGPVATMPPREVVDALHVRGHWPRVRRLRGVSDCPVMRPGGTVYMGPGYDAQSRVLVEWYQDWPQIPAAPSTDDAKRALAFLRLELLSDFPFASGTDEAAALAMILTLVGRHAIPGPVPLFLVSANDAGTGKTKLARLAGLIAHGRASALIEPPTTEEEAGKLLHAHGLEGSRCLILDNVARALGGATLDAAITSGVRRARTLGASRTVETEVPMLIATGNNVAIRGDLVRRTIPIRLTWAAGRPYERTGFRHRPLEAYVRREREALLTACLVVLRWHAASGYPAADVGALGSFEEWSQAIRQALVWLGLPDPVAGQEELYDDDLGAGDLEALINAWEVVLGPGEWLLSRDVAACRNPSEIHGTVDPEDRKALAEALAALGPRGDPERLTTRFVGYGLRRFNGQRASGYRLERGKKTKRGFLWRIMAVE